LSSIISGYITDFRFANSSKLRHRLRLISNAHLSSSRTIISDNWNVLCIDMQKKKKRKKNAHRYLFIHTRADTLRVIYSRHCTIVKAIACLNLTRLIRAACRKYISALSVTIYLSELNSLKSAVSSFEQHRLKTLEALNSGLFQEIPIDDATSPQCGSY